MKRILQSFPKYTLGFPNESTHATIKDERFIRYLKELIPTITEPNTWYKQNKRKCLEYDSKNQKQDENQNVKIMMIGEILKVNFYLIPVKK